MWFGSVIFGVAGKYEDVNVDRFKARQLRCDLSLQSENVLNTGMHFSDSTCDVCNLAKFYFIIVIVIFQVIYFLAILYNS